MLGEVKVARADLVLRSGATNNGFAWALLPLVVALPPIFHSSFCCSVFPANIHSSSSCSLLHVRCFRLFCSFHHASSTSRSASTLLVAKILMQRSE